MNLGILYILGHESRPIVTRIVTNNVNLTGMQVLRFNLLKQGDRGWCVDGVVVTHDGVLRRAIDHALDVETASTCVAANLAVLTAFDPAISGDRVVVRMYGIHEVARILGRFGRLEFVIALNEVTLFFGIGLAGDQFRLFIDIGLYSSVRLSNCVIPLSLWETSQVCFT